MRCSIYDVYKCQMHSVYLSDGEVLAEQSRQGVLLAREVFHHRQEVEMGQRLLHAHTLKTPPLLQGWMEEREIVCVCVGENDVMVWCMRGEWCKTIMAFQSKEILASTHDSISFKSNEC